MENSDSNAEPPDGLSQVAPSRHPRPRSVTVLMVGVLIITALNLSRLVLSIKYWEFLSSWPGVRPLYMAMTGFVWVLAGSLLLWGLWRAHQWAPRLMETVALTYALYYWLEQVFLIDHPVSGANGIPAALLPINWRFAAGVTVICLAYTAWTLNRKKVRAYFGLHPGQAQVNDGG